MNNNNYGYSIQALREMLYSKNEWEREKAKMVVSLLQDRLLDLWESTQFNYGYKDDWVIKSERELKETDVSGVIERLDSVASVYFQEIGAFE